MLSIFNCCAFQSKSKNNKLKKKPNKKVRHLSQRDGGRPNKCGLAKLAHGPSYFLSFLCSHFLFFLLNKVDDALFVEVNNRLFAC